MERGFDISGNQSPTNAIVVSRMNDAQYTFVMVKASEGQTFKDSQYLTHRKNAVAKKKKVGAYHFAWCNQNPVTEANNFFAAAQLQEGQLACVDLEDWGPKDTAGVRTAMVGITWAMRVTYALAWLKEFRRLTNGTVIPLLYMNWDWIKNFRTAATTAQWAELTSYPLWLADYGAGVAGSFPSVNPKVAGGPTFTVFMHQWTNNEGGLDGDALMDPAAWDKYAMEDVMTQAQYDALMGAIAGLNTRLDAMQIKVDALDADLNVATLRDQLSAKFTDLSSQVGGLAAQNTNLATSVTKVGSDLNTAIPAVVKEALSGFQVSLKFPGATP